jgi:hypothetical protein
VPQDEHERGIFCDLMQFELYNSMNIALILALSVFCFAQIEVSFLMYALDYSGLLRDLEINKIQGKVLK